MKQLDLKSFAIGVLLTTTIVLGTGAATSNASKPNGTNYSWDTKQDWDVKIISVGYGKSTAAIPPGYEPFQAYAAGAQYTKIACRKRIK